jgi:hypothetical protein
MQGKGVLHHLRPRLPVLGQLGTGIADCCARAERGKAPAPPSSVMSSRRFIRSHRRRRRYPELGGLKYYGNDFVDNYRRAAAYADRIFKGDKPGEVPVQFLVKFELVINMKTARALGLR